MKQRCIHCGQASEVEDPAAQCFICPACGKNSWISGKTGVAAEQQTGGRRFRLRDLAIGALAVLALCALAWLFFRREQPLRRLVFGDLRGPAIESPNIPANTSPPGPGVSATPGNPTAIGVGQAGPTPSAPTSGEPSGSVSAEPTAVASAGSGPGDGNSTDGNGVPAGAAINPATGLPITSPNGTQQTGGAEIAGSAGNGAGGNVNAAPSGIPASANPGATSGGTANGVFSTPNGQTATPNQDPAARSRAADPNIAASGQNAQPTSEPPSRPPGTTSSSPGASSASSPAIPPRQPSPLSGPARSSASGFAQGNNQSPQARPAGASSAAQSSSSTSDDSSTPTGQNRVANDGTEELVKLATTDATSTDGGRQKAADAAAKSTAQLAALANSDSQAVQGNTPGANSASPGDTGGALAGKRPDEERIKTDRLFDSQGSNVVFVLDHSLSMKGEKSNVARHELVRTLEKLGPEKSFYVIFFPEKMMPAPGLVAATPENIQSMANWIYSVGHSLGSNPTKAMLKALDFRPDTIWLLSDGRFSDEVPSTIRLANENIRARINTIGFYSQDGERVLKQIADENQGTYRFVAPPSKRPGGQFAPVGDEQPAQP